MKWVDNLLIIPSIDSKQLVNFIPLNFILASISAKTTPSAVKADVKKNKLFSFALALD